MATPVGGAVGVEAEHGQGRHRLVEHGGQPLGAGAIAGERHRAALGARLRNRRCVTAVVTLQALLALVEHQRDLAAIAPESVSAGPAADER